MLGLLGDRKVGAIRLGAAALVGALGSGCGGFEDGARGDAAGESGMENTDTSFDSNEGSDTDAGETASPETTGGTTNGDADPGLDPECEADCGEHGVCGAGDDGPTCVCLEPSEHWTPGGCIPCSAVPGDGLTLGLDVIDAVFEVTLAEASPPASQLDAGNLLLRSLDGQDEVLLGSTSDGTLTATMLAGLYDVYYEFDRGGLNVPANRSAKLAQVLVDNDSVIAIDIPRVLVSVSVTLDGQTPPDSAIAYGDLVMLDPETGNEVHLTRTSQPERTLWVVPGSYELRYRWNRGRVQIPANTNHLLQQVSVEENEEGVVRIAVDIPTVTLSGGFRVGGEVAPQSAVSYGEVTLVSEGDPDDRVALGTTSDGSYAAVVIPGPYSEYFTWRAGLVTFPLNRWGYIGRRDAVAPEVRDVDIPFVDLTGDITLDGAPPPTDPSNDGTLLLRTPEGDEVVLGSTRTGAYARRVMPGEYEVFYSQETASGQVPVNTNARIGDFFVESGTGAMPIDIPMSQVAGTVRLNSDAPPSSEYDDGRVYLRNRATGDLVLLGNTRRGDFAAPVIPGEYDVLYGVESAGTDVPVNARAIVGHDWIAEGPHTLDVDIHVRRVFGRIESGGMVPGAAGGFVLLEDVRTQDEIFLGSLEQPTFEHPLTVGRYLARYRSDGSTLEAPANTNAILACVDVD
jgi:hypothetical protein